MESDRPLSLPILTQSCDSEKEAPCLQEDSADDSSVTNPFIQTLSLTPLTMNGMFMMKCLATITDNSWQSIGIVKLDGFD